MIRNAVPCGLDWMINSNVMGIAEERQPPNKQLNRTTLSTNHQQTTNPTFYSILFFVFLLLFGLSLSFFPSFFFFFSKNMKTKNMKTKKTKNKKQRNQNYLLNRLDLYKAIAPTMYRIPIP